MSVADRLRAIMPNRGDVPEMARNTGIAKTTIQNWVNGVSEPDLSAAARIAATAGVSLDWLATGEGPKLLAERSAFAAPAPAADSPLPALDEGLLAEVLEAVEEWLVEHRRTLAPDRKAAVIAELYAMELEDTAGRKPTLDPRKVARILKLVA